MDAEDPSRGPSPESQAEANDPAYAARYGDRLTELVKRLQREPDVAAVTMSATEPGNEGAMSVEIEGTQPGQTLAGDVRIARVGINFFEVFDVPVLAGRQFRSGDLHDDATAVIVNRAFAQRFFGGGSPLGRRISHRVRLVSGGADLVPHKRTYEVVGVVDNFPHPMLPGEIEARLYHPVPPERLYFARVAMRIRAGDPGAFAGRLRDITAALDPALQLKTIVPLDEFYRWEQMGLHWTSLGLGLVTLSVLLLSAAGIYALMSVTVSRRRREIGIRVALGADARRILQSVLSRAAFQLSMGVLIGVAAAMLLDAGAGGQLLGGMTFLILPAVSVFMVIVGLLASLGPVRRGLRINPTEALKAE